MLHSFLIGLIATSSLVLGGLITSWFSLSKKALGVIMAFGAGALISAVAYELIFEAIKAARGTYFPGFGFFAGAFVFYFSDKLIEKLGTKDRMTIGASHSSKIVVPMVLAIILDGIPESIVLGLGIFEEGKVSIAMLVAIFISGLPESIAASNGMKSGGWSLKKIILLWLALAILFSFATLAGFSLFTETSKEWLSFIQAFAGGAIMMMLANTMMPESYEHGGKLAGVFTVLGFAVSVMVVLLEHST
jgi:ZIP family zinc transporter